jgi:hypothetical protein
MEVYKSITEIEADTGTILTARRQPALIHSGVADEWGATRKVCSVEALCEHYGSISFDVGMGKLQTLEE